MTRPTCATCRFWRNLDQESGEEIGWCQRFPPTVAGVPDASEEDGGAWWGGNADGCAKFSGFPGTYGSEWCGEWQAIAGTPANDADWKEFFGGLPVRPRNCLEFEGVDSFAKLDALCDRELLRIRNFGKVSLLEVRTRRALFAGVPKEPQP